nr:hypothetical protein Iba_chr07bCG5990 [Ipomoea batatas]
MEQRIQLRKLTSSTEPHTALYVGRGRGRSPNLGRGSFFGRGPSTGPFISTP